MIITINYNTHRDITPKGKRAKVYEFQYTFGDEKYADSPDKLQNERVVKVRIEITNWLKAKWQLNESDTFKTAYWYSRKILEEKLLDGTLSDTQEHVMHLNSYGDAPPPDLSKIPDHKSKFTVSLEEPTLMYDETQFKLASRNNMKELNRFYKSIDQDLIRAAQSTSDFARSVHSAFDSFKQLSIQLNASKAMSPTVRNLMAQAYAGIELAAVNSNLLDDFSSRNTRVAAEQMRATVTFASITQFSTLTQNIFDRIDLTKAGSLLFSESPILSQYRSQTLSLTEAYSVLSSKMKLSDLLARIPTEEIFAHANLADSVSIERTLEDDEENLLEELNSTNDSLLKKGLERVNPDLLRLWHGAKQSIDSKNPDKIRHALTSLRELLTTILHNLSPDNHVRTWNSDPTLYYNGNPTRRARLLYICREINNEPMEDFVETDIKSVLTCFDLFQGGTHKIDSSISDNQLHAIKLRTENIIRFLLQLDDMA